MMRGKTPAQKVENVIAYLARQLARPGGAFEGFDVQPSRRMDDTKPSGDPALPSEDPNAEVPAKVCDVRCRSCKLVADLDDEWEARVELIPRVQMDDDEARRLDGAVRGFYDTLSNVPGIKVTLNYPSVTRPEPDFFLVDIYQESQDMDNSERFYKDSVGLCVKFRDDNGQGPGA